MSTSAAIRLVTDYLVTEIKAAIHDLDVQITVGPPARLQADSADPTINLFLFQIGPDAAWRNLDPPKTARSGDRVSPLLPLRLNYMISVFSAKPDDEDSRTTNESQAHEFLGRIMLRLHEKPFIPAKAIGDQPESGRITLQPYSAEEMTKLWTSFQSPYRLSAVYEVAPVLIDSLRPSKRGLPVLSRGDVQDRGFTAIPRVRMPKLNTFRFPAGQPALALGGEFVAEGESLDANDLRLLIKLPPVTVGVPPAPDTIPPRDRIARPKATVVRSVDELRARFPDDWDVFKQNPFDPAIEDPQDPDQYVPNEAANWPPGLYMVSAALRVETGGIARLHSTAAIALPIMPEAVPDGNNIPLPVATGTFVVPVRPPILVQGFEPKQQVKVFIGNLECPCDVEADQDLANDLTRLTLTLAQRVSTIEALREQAPESLFLRIQIDGIDHSPMKQGAATREFDEKLLVDLVP